ncbi:MAG: hypothetical protein ISS95_00765 [Candidatus Aenigmarchaeota archaeon]|nr:hypothetical protein [Candidatus Aenigmarchaeota archaeon]
MGGNYEIRTDVLRDIEWSRNYKGQHPSKLIKKIPTLMKEIYKCQSSDFFSDHLKWDVSDSNETQFYGEWRARYKTDDRTKIWAYVKIHGYQDPRTKMGRVNVRIKSTIVTKMVYSNIFMLAMLYMYYTIFYVKQSRDNHKIAMEFVEELDAEIRGTVKGPETSGTSGSGGSPGFSGGSSGSGGGLPPSLRPVDMSGGG